MKRIFCLFCINLDPVERTRRSVSVLLLGRTWLNRPCQWNIVSVDQTSIDFLLQTSYQCHIIGAYNVVEFWEGGLHRVVDSTQVSNDEIMILDYNEILGRSSQLWFKITWTGIYKCSVCGRQTWWQFCVLRNSAGLDVVGRPTRWQYNAMLRWM